jgi:hypothetical protein
LLEERGEDLLFNLDCKDASSNVNKIKESWKTDFKGSSHDWFDLHEDLFRACFQFVDMILKEI